MTQEKKITDGLDKDLKQLIDAEMNDPVIGKLLDRNAAYVLGKEIKLALIERVCDWLERNASMFWDSPCNPSRIVELFKKDFEI